jgi:hypothetical protein
MSMLLPDNAADIQDNQDIPKVSIRNTQGVESFDGACSFPLSTVDIISPDGQRNLYVLPGNTSKLFVLL